MSVNLSLAFASKNGALEVIYDYHIDAYPGSEATVHHCMQCIFMDSYHGNGWTK